MNFTPPYNSKGELLEDWELVEGHVYKCDNGGSVQLCALWRAPSGLLFHEKGYVNALKTDDSEVLKLLRETSQLQHHTDTEGMFRGHLHVLQASAARKL